MIQTLAVVLVAAVTVMAAPLSGSCPDPAAMSTFNVTRFAGLWFDAAHTLRGTGLQLSCDQVKFTSTVPTKMSFVSASTSSATKNNIMASGDAELQAYTGKLNVNIPALNKSGEVRVLNTDYQTYAVLWSCQSSSGSHTERTLILTRDKHPSSSVLRTAKRTLENNNISKGDLNESAQHKCPEYNFSDVTQSPSLGYGTSIGSLLTASA